MRVITMEVRGKEGNSQNCFWLRRQFMLVLVLSLDFMTIRRILNFSLIVREHNYVNVKSGIKNTNQMSHCFLRDVANLLLVQTSCPLVSKCETEGGERERQAGRRRSDFLLLCGDDTLLCRIGDWVTVRDWQPPLRREWRLFVAG